jgi:hypothetical protein
MVMPDATTLIANQKFEVVNTSTGAITVNANGGANVGTVAAASTTVFRVTDISTAAGTWDVTTGAASGTGGLSSAESGQFSTLAASGFSSKSTILKFNPEEISGNYWISKANLTTAKDSPTASSINGFLYTSGGRNGSTRLTEHERFSDDANFWLARTAFTNARNNSNAFADGTKIYLVGGVDSSGNALNSVQAYTDSTDTWAAAANLPTAKDNTPCGYVDGYGYAVAGSTNNGSSAITENVAYSPSLNSWSTRASISTARYRAAGYVSANNTFYVTCGANTSGNPLQSTEQYFTHLNSVIAGPDAPAVRDYAVNFVAANMGFLASGSNGVTNGQTTNFRFNMENRVWTSDGGIMNVGRYDAQASGSTLNGAGYSSGGTNTSNAQTNSSESFIVFSLFKTSVDYKTSSAISSLSASVITNALTFNVPVQVRTDSSEWKTFMSGGSALKANETLAAKFNISLTPYWAGGTPDNATAKTTVQYYNDNANSWITRQGMANTRFGHGSFTVNGKSIQMEGEGTSNANRHSAEKYDELLNTWTAITTITSTYVPIGIHGFQVGGFGYGVGGSTNAANYNAGQTANTRYNLTLDSWLSKTALPAGIAGGFSGTQSDRGFVAAGHAVGGAATNSNYRYNPITDSWATLQTLTSSRAEGCGGAALNGFSYAIGGSGGPANAEKYNDGTNSWSTAGSLSVNHGAASQAAPAANGFLYAAGNGFASATSEKYNDGTNTWSSIASPTTDLAYGSSSSAAGTYYRYELRVGLPAYIAGAGGGLWVSKAAALIARHITGGGNVGDSYVVNGGLDISSNFTARTDVYAGATDSWKQVANSNFVHTGPFAFSLLGMFYSCGGQTSAGVFSNNNERYDISLNTWTTKTASNLTGHNFCSGVTLNGLGYRALGRQGSSTYLQSTESYNASTDAWTNKASVSSAGRMDLISFPLNGFYYTAGGNASGTPSSAVDQYNDAANSFVTRTALSVARDAPHGSITNGRGYIIAGTNGSNFSSTEFYSDALNLWYTGPNCITATQGGNAYGNVLGNPFKTGGSPDTTATEMFVPSLNKAVLSAGLSIS